MRITIENSNIKETEALLRFIQKLKLEKISIFFNSKDLDIEDSWIPISKGDKSIDPSRLFGMWKNKPRKIKNLRNKSWKRS